LHTAPPLFCFGCSSSSSSGLTLRFFTPAVVFLARFGVVSTPAELPATSEPSPPLASQNSLIFLVMTQILRLKLSALDPPNSRAALLASN
jgi:hypothetical protein